MPAVICNIHGQHISPHACRHAAERIWARKAPGPVIFVELDKLLMKSWMCGDCVDLVQTSGLKDFLDSGQEEDPDGLLRLLEDLFVPVCPRCFEELAEEPSGPAEADSP